MGREDKLIALVVEFKGSYANCLKINDKKNSKHTQFPIIKIFLFNYLQVNSIQFKHYTEQTEVSTNPLIYSVGPTGK